MATKSDFAQKLLHDLRHRMDQRATGKTHSDANAQAGRFSQGSQQIKAIESDGSEIGNSQRSSSRNRSFHVQESYGEVAKMNSSGNNPMLGFLHRLTSFQKLHHSSNNHHEISKGAEKLNQIQRACSNSVGFDEYSTEVGKELLKGSLRMLVNLEEASDYITSPERKNQMMVLEDDEEDTAKVANQKRPDLPRFSFDEPCNNQETVKTEMKQQETSNLGSHRRLSSCTDFAAQSTNLELKNQSKGRLSNVVAKLMGLDELPQSANAKALRRGSISESEPQAKLALKHKKGTVQIENETSERFLLNNQQKPNDIIEVAGDNNQANQKEQKLKVNKHKGRQAEAKISQTVRPKEPILLEKRFPVNQVSHGKTNVTKSTTGTPQKSLPNSVYTELPAKDGPKVTMGSSENRNMNQNALPKKLPSRTREGVGTNTLARKKPIKVPSAEKKIHRKGDFCKIDGSSRKGTPQHMERFGKQTAIFKATESKSRQDKPKEAKQNITMTHKSEVSSKPLSSAQELNGETKDCIYIAGEKDCQNLEAPISSGNQKDIALKLDEIHIDQQDDKSCQVFQDEKDRFDPIKLPENQKGSMKISSVIKRQELEPLTEPERHLKELLVTSQLFLNTIEALFKLNIPTSTLQTNDPNSKSSEFKLKLHCSYEVVRRKARRRRLLNHPYAKISMGCIKVRSLDDLIKQLCKGFDILNSYWSKGKANCYTAADYLHTMLEKDIQNMHPDLNSMWDFGWDTMMSTSQEKDEIIRDVEKHLLNGLLDEITLDLFQISA